MRKICLIITVITALSGASARAEEAPAAASAKFFPINPETYTRLPSPHPAGGFNFGPMARQWQQKSANAASSATPPRDRPSMGDAQARELLSIYPVQN